jgi:hypothetical protein
MGRTEIRRFGDGAPDQVSAVFRFRGDEMGVFQHFFERDLNLSINWFDAYWLPGLGYSAHKARILGYPKKAGKIGHYTDVVVTLLIQKTEWCIDDAGWPSAGPGAPGPTPPTTGAVVAWGGTTGGIVAGCPVDLDAVKVVIGGDWACALKADGTVHMWGTMALWPTGWENLAGIKDIAATTATLIYLTTSGSIAAFGRNVYGLFNFPTIINGVGIYGNRNTGLVAREDGSLSQWGDGAVTIPAGLTDPKYVNGGDYEFIAIDQSDKMWMWGAYNDGQVLPPYAPDVTDAICCSISRYSACVYNPAGFQTWGTKPATGIPAGFAPAQLNSQSAVAGILIGIHNDGTVIATSFGYPLETNIPTGLKAMWIDSYSTSVGVAIEKEE